MKIIRKVNVEFKNIKKLPEELELFYVTSLINEELKKVKKWNEKTFPDATMAGQLMKLEEELKELKEAGMDKKEFYKELADVFIVLGGLSRWDSLIGNIITHLYLDNASSNIRRKILKAIRRKMDINRKRTWTKSGDGKFQHSNKE